MVISKLVPEIKWCLYRSTQSIGELTVEDHGVQCSQSCPEAERCEGRSGKEETRENGQQSDRELSDSVLL